MNGSAINRQEYAFVCVREKEGFGKRRNHRKRRERAVGIAGATCNQHANENSITHPTNNFLSFLLHKYLIIFFLLHNPPPSLSFGQLFGFFFLPPFGINGGKGRGGGGGFFAIFLFDLRNFLCFCVLKPNTKDFCGPPQKKKNGLSFARFRRNFLITRFLQQVPPASR